MSNSTAAAAAAAAAAAEELAGALAAFNPNPTIGALLVGTLGSLTLWGISTAQVYVYFERFPNDYIYLKTFVFIVWSTELAHSICSSYITYFYAVTNYGDPLVFLDKIPPTLTLTVIFGAASASLVQAFYAFRIWTLAPNRLFKAASVLIWTAILVFFGGSTAATALSFKAVDIPIYDNQYSWLLIFVTALNVMDDCAISICMVSMLVYTRKRSMKNTTILMDKLIEWTIETGMLTAIIGTIGLILLIHNPSDFIWIALQFIKSRLFSNALLASLNSRTTLRNLASSQTTGGMMSAGMRGLQSQSNGGGVQSELNIAMTRVTLQQYDDIETPGYRSPRERERFGGGLRGSRDVYGDDDKTTGMAM
ncbi:hypothetical protein HMN09_01250100 [Mycena chlorophos]|uniref:DUF6534 domain-containing protein n=1 Tax=Mycena chlorophos TaxID=658473 RepID=A0A8H6S1K5_MYCCL|nr:hypothetical protein HMN09_01250100 [Mycena chlorophos]